MKKYLNYSLSYGVMGLMCGVYFREFTKIMGFTGITTLSKAHPHFLILGTMLFLIVALFSDRLDLEKDKTFALFMRIYILNILNFIHGKIRMSQPCFFYLALPSFPACEEDRYLPDCLCLG